jgi:hypothetical protein
MSCLINTCFVKTTSPPPLLQGVCNFLTSCSFLLIFSVVDVPRGRLRLFFGHHEQCDLLAKTTSKHYLKWSFMGCSILPMIKKCWWYYKLKIVFGETRLYYQTLFSPMFSTCEKVNHQPYKPCPTLGSLCHSSLSKSLSFARLIGQFSTTHSHTHLIIWGSILNCLAHGMPKTCTCIRRD